MPKTKRNADGVREPKPPMLSRKGREKDGVDDGPLGRIQMLRQELVYAEAEVERQANLIESLQAARDQLRRRVLQAAAGGPVCSKCAAEMPVPAPQVPVQPQAPAPVEVAAHPEVVEKVVASVGDIGRGWEAAPPARFDPACHLCRANVCDGKGNLPCAQHGGVGPGAQL